LAEIQIFNMLIALRDRCLSAEQHIQRSLQLTPSEFKALLQLFPGETVSCGEFTGRLGLSDSRSSRVVDRLVKRSVLQRLESSSDRRCKQVKLTEEGVHLQELVREGINGCEQRLTASIPPHRLQTVKTVLEDLLKNSLL
jgi:DNA-binding MarR family transcriptional regulator